ncbi:hypothetical protein QNM97_12175 [Gordonia sp. L191]|nr:hypothetical protein [Gordonia sp. L191]WHU49677.1 hypothetical protein QNM97_12175 [Gordonia sp. L191]
MSGQPEIERIPDLSVGNIPTSTDYGVGVPGNVTLAGHVPDRITDR